MFTVKEAAEKLRVSISMVYELAKERRIPHCRIGVGRGRVMLRSEDIEAYVASCKVDARPLAAAIQLKHLKL